MDYESVEVQLNPGDCVIIFTDGVTDSLSAQNEAFGMPRVKEAILGDGALSVEGQSPQEIGKRLIAAVQRHSAGQYQNDDIALVVFGRLDDEQIKASESGRIATGSGPMTQTMKRVPGMLKD